MHYQFLLHRNSTKVRMKLFFVTYLFDKNSVLFWCTIWAVNGNAFHCLSDPGKLDLSFPKGLKSVAVCEVWGSKSNSTVTITRQRSDQVKWHLVCQNSFWLVLLGLSSTLKALIWARCPMPHNLTGIQLSSSGATIVPLIFYHLHSIALDIYELKKLKFQNYWIVTSMDLSMVLRQYITINHSINITIL
jgi:hypothetical protein